MSETTERLSRAERNEDLMTILSGWGALVLFVLGIHRWVSEGTFDWWARAGLIFSLGLGIMWIWGYWDQVSTRVRGWVRGGGLNTTIIAVVLILSLIIINTLARRRMPARWDLTKNQRYSLAPQSRDVLKKLEKPVKVTVFMPTGSRNWGRAKDLLDQYEESDKFTWERIDPLVNLEKVLAIGAQQWLSPDLSGALLQSGEKQEKVTDFTEKAMTGAILKLTRDVSRKVYFLQGHGELSPDPGPAPQSSMATVAETLKAVQWPVEKLDLLGKNVKAPDPADAAVIVIAGPQKALYPEETKRLQEYLDKGGSILLLLRAGGPSYADFLKPWGITTTNDLVVDTGTSQGIVIVEKFEDQPAVKGLSRAAFPTVRSVTPATPAPTGITVTALVKTEPSGLRITNFQPGKPINAAGGKPGEYTIAAVAEKSIGTGDTARKARVAVVGDASFASEMMAPYRGQLDNVGLASGLVNYLGEEDALVAIPPKDENTEQAFLTPSQGRMILLIHFLDFPLLALALAIMVYLKRR